MSSTPAKRPIGELLKDRGYISDEHISYALQQQKITRERIGELLDRLGFVTKFDLLTALAEQHGVPYIDLDEILPDEKILTMFNKNILLNNSFLPLNIYAQTIDVAVEDPSDPKLAPLIRRQTGLDPVFYLADGKKIINAVNQFYYFFENPVEKTVEKEINILSADSEGVRGMDSLIKHILHMAVKMRATDIHIQPMQKSITISFRIDSVMHSIMSLPVALNRFVSSIKLKADMDIAEQRLPQDGRFSMNVLNNAYDFRVSTIVSQHGEDMVLRILPKEGTKKGIKELGFYDEHIRLIEQLFNEPSGIILITGPTGSGKSTTLYAGISKINLIKKNVITVEDPVEYHIPLLRQTQVNLKAGYSFSSAIRHFLRHDPDVILVGEIRDQDTAATAVTASNTGHLVLSTLHTNTAVGAVSRLRDLGVRPFLIADTLLAVVSQRLVRRICNGCKDMYQPSEEETAYLRDPSITELFKGRGCDLCGGTGYQGRTLVYELFLVNDEIATMIDTNADMSLIARKARETGSVDIFDVTLAKVKQGITTTEEAMRVLGHTRQT
ncbi:MAG: Flp pilus assembly complex ATPase component [Deltaproteobacteria bacterium]|nr:Flp pilus assembly complex ATPase component [Deltaproteobacteria bacterium]